MSRYAGLERGAQALAAGIVDRRQRKDEQKREQQLIEGMAKMMEHPAVARYFPEDFDPYAVGAQGTLQALDLASRAIALEGQEAQTDAQRTQTEAQRMQTDRLRQGFEGEERLLRGLSQTAGGVGEGVLRPEVVDRQRAMLADPAVATAVEHGVPLEVAQRYFPGGGEAGVFSPEQMGVARPIEGVEGRFFVPTARTAGQIVDVSERAGREHNIESLVRLQREARQRGDAEAEEIYGDAIDRVRGGGVLGERAQEFLAMTNPQLLADLTREQIASRRAQRESRSDGGREEREEPAPSADPKTSVDDFFKGL